MRLLSLNRSLCLNSLADQSVNVSLTQYELYNKIFFRFLYLNGYYYIILQCWKYFGSNDAWNFPIPLFICLSATIYAFLPNFSWSLKGLSYSQQNLVAVLSSLFPTLCAFRKTSCPTLNVCNLCVVLKFSVLLSATLRIRLYACTLLICIGSGRFSVCIRFIWPSQNQFGRFPESNSVGVYLSLIHIQMCIRDSDNSFYSCSYLL